MDSRHANLPARPTTNYGSQAVIATIILLAFISVVGICLWHSVAYITAVN